MPRERIGCVIEVKYAEGGAFDEAIQRGMAQIRERDYAAQLRREGMETIRLYTMAFYRKTCRVGYEGADL